MAHRTHLTYTTLGALVCSALINLNAMDESAAQGVEVSYYTGSNFETLERTEERSDLSFNWDRGGPFDDQADGPTDSFSARWRGQVVAPSSGRYVLRADFDDYYRLWVGDRLVINAWGGEPAVIDAEVSLTAGRLTPIMIEFAERFGAARALLSWRLVDEADEAFMPISLNALSGPIADPPLPRVGLVARDARALEGHDPARFTVYRLGVLDDELVVSLIFSGDAEEGRDYVNPPREVRIPAQRTTADFDIRRVDDSAARGARALIVRVESSERYTLLRDVETTLTLLDDERDASGDERFTMAGVISGAEASAKVKLEVRDQGEVAASLTQQGSGPFGLEPLPEGAYHIRAWLDLDDDGARGDDEPRGVISLDDATLELNGDGDALLSLPPHQLGVEIRFNEERSGGDSAGESAGEPAGEAGEPAGEADESAGEAGEPEGDAGEPAVEAGEPAGADQGVDEERSSVDDQAIDPGCMSNAQRGTPHSVWILALLALIATRRARARC